MNKRITCCIGAVLVLSSVLTACEDKKKPEPKLTDTTVNEDTGDTPVDSGNVREYREYTDDEFRTVEINLSYPDKEPHVEVSCIDISELTFGSRIPICNTEEYIGNYFLDMNLNNENMEYDWSDISNMAVNGIAQSCSMYEGKCYIVVEYPNFIYGRYDFSLYHYDEKSGTNEEIFSWSSKDINEHYCNTPILIENEMFYGIENASESTTKIYAYDMITGDTRTIFEESDFDKSVWFYQDDRCFPAIQLMNKGGEVTDVMYYDSASDSFIGSELKDIGEKSISNNTFNGVNYFLVKPEGKRKLDMVSEYYRVSTSFTSGAIIYADENKFIINNNVYLHMYDLEKMEHYLINATELGNATAYCNGFLFIGCKSTGVGSRVYCMIPELGITYPITENDNYIGLKTIGDKVTFNAYEEYNTSIQPRSGKGGIVLSSNKVNKVYTVTVK
ncbi:hypothetical protein [Ruminococcus flavefaciens]|uniref:DUF5050 domain-containing protein n=1 Tax=Ruminococcus flavefaciens TaxID=1265 RepID=A0A1M7G5K7_RUMFL|nr:hypothetical protein [Ruminococcus flavefaciens]SHM11368.1 hypothetical protein SAMN04487860_10166 [Ruminococcus flavefaciens]